MRSDVVDRLGEERLRFVQGIASGLLALSLGVAAGIVHAASELGATQCADNFGQCGTIAALQQTAYQAVGVTILSLVVLFAIQWLLNAIQDTGECTESESSDSTADSS